MPMQYSNGLTLIPREVNSMIAEMKSVIGAYNSELEDATHPTVSYAFENGLDGKAYTNSKHHMEDHLTVIRGAVAANKKFESCLDKLSAIVGNERLVEEELRDTIKSCNSRISDYRAQKLYYMNKLYDPAYDLYCGGYARRRIQHCKDSIDGLTAIKKRTEEKIKRLYEINGESAKCFDSISNSYIAVMQGIKSLNSGRAVGGFAPRINAEWRTSLHANLNSDYISEIIEQFRECNIELTEEDKKLINRFLHVAPSAGETLSELTKALLVVKSAYISGADIYRRGDYVIIKGLPALRSGIPQLAKAKGTRYKLLSDGYFSAELDYWIPKGERSLLKTLSKSGKNLGQSFNNQFAGGIKGFVDDTFRFSASDTGITGKVGNVGTAMGYVGVAINVATGFHDNYKSGEKEITKYAADATVDVIAGLGEMAAATACAKVGAAIGTAIPIPVVGTAVGAVAGFAVGYLASKALNSELANSVKDSAKEGTKKIYDYGASKFKEMAKSVGGKSVKTGAAVAT